jgi:VanZ family protein
VLKTFYLVITILYSIALTIICLVKIDGIVSNVGLNIPFGDKIFHLLSYLVLTALLYNTFLYNYIASKKALMYAAILSIIFGIIIEVLQGTITTARSSDINDVFANTIGVLLTTAFITIRNKCRLN